MYSVVLRTPYSVLHLFQLYIRKTIIYNNNNKNILFIYLFIIEIKNKKQKLACWFKFGFVAYFIGNQRLKTILEKTVKKLEYIFWYFCTPLIANWSTFFGEIGVQFSNFVLRLLEFLYSISSNWLEYIF